MGVSPSARTARSGRGDETLLHFAVRSATGVLRSLVCESMGGRQRGVTGRADRCYVARCHSMVGAGKMWGPLVVFEW